MIVFPFWLITAFLALMLKWTLNLSAFVLALPMLYIFGCGLYAANVRHFLFVGGGGTGSNTVDSHAEEQRQVHRGLSA